MTGDNHIPDLDDALRKSRPLHSIQKTEPDEDFPPPPKDWTSHSAVKISLVILFTGCAAVLWIKRTPIIEYIISHTFGAWIIFAIIVALVLIILIAYWRSLMQGKRDGRYWKTD